MFQASALALISAFVLSGAQVEPPTSRPTGISLPPRNNLTDPAIIQGQRVQPGEIPFQALLYVIIPNDYYFCGGSLIHLEWVLTAAHCVNDYKIQVGLGGTNVYNMPYWELETMRIKHEQYNPATLENDIALIRIPTQANNPGLQLAQLAPRDIGLLPNHLVRASGFGFITNQGPLSENLLRVNLRTMSNTDCRQAFPPQVLVFETNLCATWLTQPGEAVCSGDSGGPLMYNTTNGLVQVGLVSFGLTSGCTTGPQAFTRISSFRDWIDNTLAANP